MDRYATAVPLAEGGTSIVYKAIDRRSGDTVALKVLRSDAPELARRMDTEVRVLQQLHHPHVARCLDSGQIDGKPYIAMEYIDGRPIDQVLADADTVTIVRMMLPVAEAIDHAHQSGILHRDLKPANVLVRHSQEGKPQPVVVDFGLAREVAEASATVTGAMLGTPAYMAPEQARGEGEQITQRTDVYGLGAVLYKLLTRRAPHVAQTSGELIVSILQDDPTAPRQLDRTVPVALEAIVMRALARRAGQRYASAAALVADLRAWLAGDRVQALKGYRWRRLRSFAVRHRTALLLSSLLVAAALALAGQQFLSSRQMADRSARSMALGEQLGNARNRLALESLAPVHDMTATMASLGRLEAQVAELAQAPETARLPAVHRVRGALLLDLDRPEAAVNAFETALGLGCQPSRCQPELALANLRLYEHYLNRVLTSLGAVEPLEKDHVTIARDLLAQIDAKGPSAVAAAAMDGDFDAARRAVERHLDSDPWDFPVLNELARGHARKGLEARQANQLELATQHLGMAFDGFRQAAAIGTSDVNAHLGLCVTALRLQEVAMISGRKMKVDMESGLEGCRQARIIAPARPQTHATEILLLERLAVEADRTGNPWQPWVQRVNALVANLPQSVQEHPAILLARARVLSLRARVDVTKVSNSIVLLEQGIDMLERARSNNPDDGQIWQAQARLLVELLQLDPGKGEQLAQRATEMVEAISARWPQERAFRNSLGAALSNLAWVRRTAGEPSPAIVERSIRVLQQLLEDAPDYARARNNLALAWREMAATRAAMGEEYAAAEDAANQQFDQLLSQDEDDTTALVNLSGLNLVLARHRLDRGMSPQGRIDVSLRALERLKGLDDYLPCDFAYAWWLKSRAANDAALTAQHAARALEQAQRGDNADCREVQEALGG